MPRRAKAKAKSTGGAPLSVAAAASAALEESGEPEPEQDDGAVELPNSVGTQTLPSPVEIPVSLLAALPGGPVYVVWKLRGAPLAYPGIHCGHEAWQRIKELIPGGCYRSGADRLRRVPDIRDEEPLVRLQRAEALYLSECLTHHLPSACCVYLWK